MRETKTLRELEVWIKQRQQQADKIQARKRKERATLQKQRLPNGYGLDGSVPAYIQAHISALEASPLKQPVFSPGRRRLEVCPSRTRSPNPEQPFAEKGTSTASRSARYYETRAAQVSTPVKRSSGTTLATVVARVGCSRPHNKEQQHAKDALSPALRTMSPTSHYPIDGIVGRTNGGVVRPATAPSAPRQRGRLVFSPVRCRRQSSTATQETQLLEKLSTLSAAHRHRGEYPTVCAFKTALAIEAVQAQLRTCRGTKLLKVAAAATGSNDQAIQTANIVNLAHDQATGAVASAARIFAQPRSRTTGSQVIPAKLTTWDNRSPFVLAERISLPASDPSSERPASAPSLRVLTANDPMFRSTEEARAGRHRMSRSKPPIAAVPGNEIVTRVSSSSRQEIVKASAAVATRHLQACFEQLTVGALVELNHLHSPPNPVLAVLAALACLLGIKSRWRDSSRRRALFNNACVLRDLLASVSPLRISPRRLSSLARKLDANEVTMARVKGASAAAAVLLEWLLAVVACAQTEGIKLR